MPEIYAKGTVLYTRKIEDAPTTLVKDGHPVFGTFTGLVKRFDIRGIKAPFGAMLLPTFLTNFRIKSRLSYCFSFANFVCDIEFFDAKLYGYMILVLWDILTGKKTVTRAILGAKMRRVPKRLSQKDSCVCLKHNKKIKLFWDRQKNLLQLKINIRLFKVKKSAFQTNDMNDIIKDGCLNLKVICPLYSQKTAQIISVSPSPTKSKCSASYKLSTACDAITNYGKINAVSLLDINRTFCKFNTKAQYIYATNIIDGFYISWVLCQSTQEAIDNNTYNENFLFVNDKITPLPPVKITQPYGLNSTWIVQDTESMIDLNFCPKSNLNHTLDAIFIKTQCNLFYGKFDGFIMDSNSKKWQVTKLSGIAKIFSMRG